MLILHIQAFAKSIFVYILNLFSPGKIGLIVPFELGKNRGGGHYIYLRGSINLNCLFKGIV